MNVESTYSTSFLLSGARSMVLACFFSFGAGVIHAETFANHVKRFTSVLSNRNLDSLRLFINPNKIYVEIAPKTGAYLSPLQTLAVIESFFRSQPPTSFSYLLIKEEGKTGIALGTLVATENNRTISYKVNFGFQKDSREHWLLGRISIH